MVKLAAGGCRHIPEARGRLSQWSSWRPAAGISPREREWLAQPVKLAAGGAGACISSRGERLAQPVKLAAGGPGGRHIPERGERLAQPVRLAAVGRVGRRAVGRVGRRAWTAVGRWARTTAWTPGTPGGRVAQASRQASWVASREAVRLKMDRRRGPAAAAAAVPPASR